MSYKTKTGAVNHAKLWKSAVNGTGFSGWSLEGYAFAPNRDLYFSTYGRDDTCRVATGDEFRARFLEASEGKGFILKVSYGMETMIDGMYTGVEIVGTLTALIDGETWKELDGETDGAGDAEAYNEQALSDYEDANPDDVDMEYAPYLDAEGYEESVWQTIEAFMDGLGLKRVL